MTNTIFKQKPLISVILAVLTLILSAAVFFLGLTLHTHSLGTDHLAAEIQSLTTENANLTSRKERLQSDINSNSGNYTELEKLNADITSLQKQLDDTASKISQTEKDIDSIKKKISSADSTARALNSGTNLTEGRSVLAENEKLSVPNDLSAGRYVASGSGTITISSSGSARDSQVLSSLDTGTYTFNLTNGQSVTAHGSVTITELK